MKQGDGSRRAGARGRDEIATPRTRLRRRRRAPLRHRRRGEVSGRASSRIAMRWPTSRRADPEDIEAAIFYALALTASAPPTDKTYANQLKAGAILEKLFAQPARSSGHRALHHSQLRRAAARRPRARRRAALREDRAVGAARAAHAVAHVHARRLLAGIDRHQHRVGRRRREAKATARGAARHATT